MGYIKEPKGVNFVMEPIPLTTGDMKTINEAIARYKATGEITRAPITKRARRVAGKKKSKR